MKLPFRIFLCALVYRCIIGHEMGGRIANFLRNRRHLLFPDPKESETKVQVLFGLGLPMEDEFSMTLGYVLKCNYNLPYNMSQLQRTSSITNKSTIFTSQQARKRKRTRSTRWTLYRILESAMETLGSGKACLLRAICEHAAAPFHRGHGLLGELLHVVLAPSTTSEEYETYADREYSAAEATGRRSAGSNSCAPFRCECERNPLDYFSAIMNA